MNACAAPTLLPTTIERLSSSSDDAILSKNLDGLILSWNRGAERLFGFTAEEAIGRPVTIIIPLDRQDEEPSILDKIYRGERIEHFETVRQRKDGSLVDISLTISPIRDARSKIVGASKIARDISEVKKARERQHLLLREMSHRVKNLFALSGSIVSLSARTAKSPRELAEFDTLAAFSAGAGPCPHLLGRLWRRRASANDTPITHPHDCCSV